jgi:hypothetical protein
MLHAVCTHGALRFPAAVSDGPSAGDHAGHVSFPSKEWRELADILYYGIAFVFLGLCLLYVRAADKL